MKHIIATTFVLGSIALFVACKHDDHSHDDGAPHGHSSEYPTCDKIIKQCHPLDVGEGPIHDCHDLGHGATKDEDCIPKADDCLNRICVAGFDAGSDAAATTPDAAAEDAAGDAHAH